MKINLISFNCRYTHSCLALFYVRAELEKNIAGCRPQIRQLTINDPYHEALLRLSAEQADAYFFSVYIWNSEVTRRVVNDLRLVLPTVPIVLGGPQAKAMRGVNSDLTVVHGEIEGVSPAFYHDLQNGTLQQDYHATPVSQFVSPYKQEDFSRQLKNRNIYYESSRGCPFSCSYCLSSVSRGVVCKDIEEVKAELRPMLALRPPIIRFVDRTFNADVQRTMDIWRFLAEEGGETTFHFEIAPDLFNEEMFEFLETVSTHSFQFEIGIQSTNPASLAAVNRKMDTAAAFANIKRLVALDSIHIHVDLILGLPFDTLDTFRRSFQDVFMLHPHYIQMGLLKVLPETPLSRQVEEFAMLACRKPPYQVLANSWLDHAQMSRLYWLGECVEAFYNTRYFKTFFAYIKQRYNGFDFFEKLLDICLENGFFTLAKTQKLMVQMLLKQISKLPEEEILKELLVFDWLLCGHRFMPESMPDTIKETRALLWESMPDETEFYRSKERNQFFKRGIFYRFSEEMLARAGMRRGDEPFGYVVFLPQQKDGVMKQCQALRLPQLEAT